MKLSELLKDAVDISIAAVPEIFDDGSTEWSIYIINKSKNDLHNVLIQSNGRGEIDAWPVKTSTLRHYINHLAAAEFSKVELMMEEVFFLENQYWVSYYVGTTIFDGKFSFPPYSIHLDKCKFISELGMNGIIAQ
jgi:hypothetical protein